MSRLTDEEREALASWLVGDLHEDRTGDDAELFAAVERIIAARVRAAKAEAWDEGKHSEHTPACRWGDGDCICPNPHREAGERS